MVQIHIIGSIALMPLSHLISLASQRIPLIPGEGKKNVGLAYSCICMVYWHQAGVDALALKPYLMETPKDRGKSGYIYNFNRQNFRSDW